MRLVRGRASERGTDRAVTGAMLTRSAETGEAAFRAWTPHRQVAFGRRDAHESGYERAKAAAADRGYPSVERSVGGRAVAYTGRTVAFAHAMPLDDARRGLDDRYEAAVDRVLAALSELGVGGEEGEPAESFCPGAHSVQCVGPDGPGKVAGVAQRVTSGGALVSGCLLVDERAELRDVLTAVYDALSVPFDPGSVGTVADAGGPDDPDAAVEALESVFAPAPSAVDDAAGLLNDTR